MIQFGMPTLIENRTLQENIDLCSRLGLRFIELNMNFPEYQVECLEQTGRLLEAADFVQMIQKRQSIVISAPEEIAYINGWTSRETLLASAAPMLGNDYGRYLQRLAERGQ